MRASEKSCRYYANYRHTLDALLYLHTMKWELEEEEQKFIQVWGSK